MTTRHIPKVLRGPAALLLVLTLGATLASCGGTGDGADSATPDAAQTASSASKDAANDRDIAKDEDADAPSAGDAPKTLEEAAERINKGMESEGTKEFTYGDITVRLGCRAEGKNFVMEYTIDSDMSNPMLSEESFYDSLVDAAAQEALPALRQIEPDVKLRAEVYAQDGAEVFSKDFK